MRRNGGSMCRSWIVIAFLAAVAPAQAASELTLLDLAHDRTLSLAEAVSVLRQKRIVVVGEEHTHAGHHRAQLRVIQALAESGAQVAIGLEMFRRDSQADLDRWVAGEMP